MLLACPPVTEDKNEFGACRVPNSCPKKERRGTPGTATRRLPAAASGRLLARLEGVEVELALRRVARRLHALRQLVLLDLARSSCGSCGGTALVAVDHLRLPRAHDGVHGAVGDAHADAGRHARHHRAHEPRHHAAPGRGRRGRGRCGRRCRRGRRGGRRCCSCRGCGWGGSAGCRGMDGSCRGCGACGGGGGGRVAAAPGSGKWPAQMETRFVAPGSCVSCTVVSLLAADGTVLLRLLPPLGAVPQKPLGDGSVQLKLAAGCEFGGGRW
mmetsp:Transcript_3412/g.10442  ORF Transcript_3412/g.10442 Transcript_3412/m.10442 type:complete len:270 (-) Transcript_3412:1145-1954(-)